MMKWKKTVALGLAAVMALSVAGCGDDGSGGQSSGGGSSGVSGFRFRRRERRSGRRICGVGQDHRRSV